MIYCVERNTYLIYEVRPLPDVFLIRPAHQGYEHLLEKISFIDFSRRFSAFLARFLMPNELLDSDYDED